MKRHRGKRGNRAGYMLVVFLAMFFLIMGIAALVIDMGFVRLAQRQMQTAVDSAALEGLRFRDDVPSEWYTPGNPTYDAIAAACGACPETPYSPNDLQWQAWIDQARRWEASQMVANTFDDDLDPTNGDTGQYGAGPTVDFNGGIGPTDVAAGQNMTIPDPPVYKPMRADGTAGLELNFDNAQNGDMVAGTYNPGQPSNEGDDYSRADFTLAPSDSSTVNAFLVRMRRTTDATGIDNQPGISCAGPTLPFLFGRGSLMARSGDTGQLSVASGITVRATAIAAAMPAKSVGPAYSAAGGTLTAAAQLAPFAIRNDLWAQISAGTATTVNPLNPNSGVLLLTSDFSTSLTAIGQPLATTSDDGALVAGPGIATYVPIYVDLPSQPATIIGFVFYAQWSYARPTMTLNLPAGTSHVGSQNVSAIIALPLPSNLNQQDISVLFQDHAGLNNLLYAPVLVDHYISPNQSSP